MKHVATRLLAAIDQSDKFFRADDCLLNRAVVAGAMAEGPLVGSLPSRGFGPVEEWNPLAFAARHSLGGPARWGALEGLCRCLVPPLRLDEPCGVPAGTTTLGWVGLALLVEEGETRLDIRRTESLRSRLIRAAPEAVLWPLVVDTAHAIMDDPSTSRVMGGRIAWGMWRAFQGFGARLLSPVRAPVDVAADMVHRMAGIPWLFQGMSAHERASAMEWIGALPVVSVAYLASVSPGAAPSASPPRAPRL